MMSNEQRAVTLIRGIQMSQINEKRDKLTELQRVTSGLELQVLERGKFSLYCLVYCGLSGSTTRPAIPYVYVLSCVETAAVRLR